MADPVIKYMFVDRAPAHLTYQAADGVEPLFLEWEGRRGAFKVRLKPGQYSWTGNETGDGTVTIELEDGTPFTGVVISSFPVSVPDGAFGPIDLELNIQQDD